MSWGVIVYDQEQSYHAMIGSGLSNQRDAIRLETTGDWYDLVERILQEFRQLARIDAEDLWPEIDVDMLPDAVRRQILGRIGES